MLIPIIPLFLSIEYIPELCLEGEQPIYRTKRRRDIHSCEKCEPGMSAPENGICIDCKSGMYQPNHGMAVCIGSICPAGYYGTSKNTKLSETICIECPSGKFSDSSGLNNCKACPAGKWSNTSTSIKCWGSICLKGYYGKEDATAGRECKVCPMSKYSLEKGSLSCTQCPIGSWRNASLIDQTCFKVDCDKRFFPTSSQDGSCEIWYKDSFYRNIYIVNCCFTLVTVLILICYYYLIDCVDITRFLIFNIIFVSIYNIYLTDDSAVPLVIMFNGMGMTLLWCSIMDKARKWDNRENNYRV